MADETSMPAGEAPEAPKTDVTTTTTTDNTPAPEAPAAASAPSVDLHGLDPNQLGDIAKFLKGQGGFEALKSRMSNPENYPQQPQPAQPTQPTQPAPQQPQPAQPQAPAAPEVPEGFVSPQALQLKGYFDKLAADPKYANIAEQISNGDILKEMASFGMTPVDNNYNVNIGQLTKFLDLKSASVPAKPATTEITTTPTADYTPVEGEITSTEQAWNVIRENVMYTSQGKAPNPALAQAEEYLKKAGAFGPVAPTQPTK